MKKIVIKLRKFFEFRKKPLHVTVKVGSIILHDHEGKIHYGKEIIIHEEYNKQTEKNDIALLRVKPSIEFSNNVSPINISISDVEEGDFATFAAWGRLQVC